MRSLTQSELDNVTGAGQFICDSIEDCISIGIIASSVGFQIWNAINNTISSGGTVVATLDAMGNVTSFEMVADDKGTKTKPNAQHAYA